MKIKLYNDIPRVDETQPTVFLSGLTDTKQFNTAIQTFEDIAPNVLLYIPFNGTATTTYSVTKDKGGPVTEIQPIFKGRNIEQNILWERKAMAIADCILFWIPSENEFSPKTFITFGEWVARKPNQILLGHPETIELNENIRYMDNMYDNYCDAGYYAENSFKEAAKRAAEKAADFKIIREYASIYKNALPDVTKCRQIYNMSNNKYREIYNQT